MSDCGIVKALIFLRLLYADSCRKSFFMSLVACIVFVLYFVAFSDHGTAFRQPQRVCVKLYIVAVSAKWQRAVSEGS